METHDVVIAGGGPTGMMLAAELTLAGVDVVLVERRENHDLVGSRAGGIHIRTIEVLDQRGVADRFITAGSTHPAAMFATVQLDVTDLPTRHPYTLGIWQNQIERIMADWIAELGVRPRYGRTVRGVTQDAEGVEVALADGTSLRARYLVGCDGGRSTVRRAAQIGFGGWDATRSNLIAEVELTEEHPVGIRRDATGVHGLHTLENGHTVRVITTEQELNAGGEPGLAELSAALIAIYGTDFGAHDPTWISRFTDATRQAERYRSGRVLLAGDAAHIHYPTGGQGIGLGIQDAVNLGWKLGQVIAGVSPETLLDTYHAERHPIAAETLRTTMAMGELTRAGDRIDAVYAVVKELLGIPAARRHMAGVISGLSIHYDLGEGHPLLGRRMPDLDLLTPDGPRRVFALLHAARPLLLNLGTPGAVASDRVGVVDARHDGVWELPVLGAVAAPSAVLIRPDGYVAWVGEGGEQTGLAEAVGRWC